MVLEEHEPTRAVTLENQGVVRLAAAEVEESGEGGLERGALGVGEACVHERRPEPSRGPEFGPDPRFSLLGDGRLLRGARRDRVGDGLWRHPLDHEGGKRS